MDTHTAAIRKAVSGCPSRLQSAGPEVTDRARAACAIAPHEGQTAHRRSHLGASATEHYVYSHGQRCLVRRRARARQKLQDGNLSRPIDRQGMTCFSPAACGFATTAESGTSGSECQALSPRGTGWPFLSIRGVSCTGPSLRWTGRLSRFSDVVCHKENSRSICNTSFESR